MKLSRQLSPILLLWSSQTVAPVVGSKLQKPLGGGASSSPSPSSLPSLPAFYSNAAEKDGGDDNAPPYRESLVSLHRSLVEIPSITYDENAVGQFLVDYLMERGFVARIEPVPLPPSTNSSSSSSSSSTPGPLKPRFNVLAWPGPTRHPRPKVLVTSHIDTVPPYIPYSLTPPEASSPLGPDTLIAGRGSVDAKASVAAQIAAVTSLLESGRLGPGPGGSPDGGENYPRDSVMLLYVVGEERSGDGMRQFSAELGRVLGPGAAAPAFGAAIFGEPTEGRLACGHKGFFACAVAARGRAGHSGYPWLGRSATEALMRGLVAVLDADLGSSAEFGNTTVNVGAIGGGVAANVIAESAAAQLAGRVAIGPETDGGRVAAERLVDVLTSVDPDAFDVQCRNGYGVVRCDCDVEGRFFSSSSPSFDLSSGFLVAGSKYLTLCPVGGPLSTSCSGETSHADVRTARKTQDSRPPPSTTGRTCPTSRATTRGTCTGRGASWWRTARTRPSGSGTSRPRSRDTRSSSCTRSRTEQLGGQAGRQTDRQTASKCGIMPTHLYLAGRRTSAS